MILLYSILISLSAFAVEQRPHIETFPWKDAKTPVKVISFDGTPKRVEKFYEDRKRNLSIRRVEVGDRHFVTSDTLLQKDECPIPGPGENTTLQLATDVRRMGLDADGDYFVLQQHRVHKSCFEKWGPDNFSNSLGAALGTDMQCLDHLGLRPVKNKNHAKTIAHDLRNLWNKTPVTIQCNEPKDWSTTSGHASTDRTDTMDGLPKVHHPYISIASTDPKAPANPTDVEKSQLTSTIFHEGIHNLGYKHGSGVEYTYACESCCSPDSQAKAKVSSCNVCVGDYSTGAGDKAYLKDMLAWGASFDINLRADLPMKTAINYMHETADTKYGMLALATSTANPFSPLGLEMMKQLKRRIPETSLTPEDRVLISDSDFQREYFKDLVPFRPAADVIAHSYIDYYMDKDSTKALGDIEAGKVMLAEILRRPQTGNNIYVIQELKKNLKTVLVDVLLKDYPKPSSSKAIELEAFFKL
jgi:hypothetical protein